MNAFQKNMPAYELKASNILEIDIHSPTLYTHVK
jgi:hypothetical protein